jgi:predicted GIY-YIG superfamily endonuclease
MPNYSNTIIYVIKCKDVNIIEEYVGHTTDINSRKYTHKGNCNNEKSNNYNSYKYKFIRENGGWDNWEFIEIEKYPCNNKTEALNKEEEIRKERQSKLNSIRAFINKEDRKEINKQFYYNNKEEILNKRKQYYDNNKEKVLEQHKNWYDNNKEKVLETSKLWCINNKEKSKQYKLNYFLKNKEKIFEKMSETYECICGSIIRNDSKWRHEKSVKHNKNLEK